MRGDYRFYVTIISLFILLWIFSFTFSQGNTIINKHNRQWLFLNNKTKSTLVKSLCIYTNTNWIKKHLTFKHHNFVFNLYDSNDIVSNEIHKKSKWEASIVNKILYLLNETSIQFGKELSFLDIGANIGWFTTIIAKHGWNTIAFEPMNNNIEILSRNLCDNDIKNARVFHTGLSDNDKQCWIIAGHINKGDGVMVCDKKPENSFRHQNGYDYSLIQEINMTRLDDYLNFDYYPPIGIAKIDVEGHEFNVLKGGIQWLTKYTPYYIFMELWTIDMDLILFMYKLNYYISNKDCEDIVIDASNIKIFLGKYKSQTDFCFVYKILIE